MITELVHAAMERSLNLALSLDPVATERLEGLQGSRIAVDLSGLGQFLLIVGARQIRIASIDEEDGADCSIRGTPVDLIRMTRGGKTVSGKIQLEGNTELATQLGRILGGLEVDWEEQLSRITGDVLASQAGNMVRDLRDWGRNTRFNLSADLGEYLQEEVRLLPCRLEVEEFLDGVDQVRDHTERLAARIELLRTALEKR